jgi:hypothetical protein
MNRTPHGHCSGCTDPDPFCGTHCEGTIEHPFAPPSEPTCGICGVCESWHPRTGCDKWTPVAATPGGSK